MVACYRPFMRCYWHEELTALVLSFSCNFRFPVGMQKAVGVTGFNLPCFIQISLNVVLNHKVEIVLGAALILFYSDLFLLCCL